MNDNYNKFYFRCRFSKEFNKLNFIYVFNITVLYNRLYIFHLYLFSGLFVYFI